MKKRQQLFVQYYLNKTDLETYHNATKSAQKAGYSLKTAYSTGSRLLKEAEIKALIDNSNLNDEEKYRISKEQAIVEARKNFEEASTPGMKKFWWEQWAGLQGWDVKKFENKNTQEVTVKTQEQIAETVRKQLQESLN